MLEQVVAGHEHQRPGLPDREPVVAPRQLGHPAGARLDGARLEPRQALGDVGGRVGVAHPDRVAVVARQRVAVGAVLAVLQARQRRRLAHRIRVARVGRDPHREVEAGAAARIARVAAGADDDPVVRRDRAARADLAGRRELDHLVGDDRVSERRDQGADGRGASGSRRRPRRAAPVPRARGSAARSPRRPSGRARRRRAAARSGRSTAGPSATVPPAPRARSRTAAPTPASAHATRRQRDEPRVVVGVPEDPRLAAGLRRRRARRARTRSRRRPARRARRRWRGRRSRPRSRQRGAPRASCRYAARARRAPEEEGGQA